MMIQPTKIQVDRSQRRVTIQWADGHESGYSFDGLRFACPCVHCKGGHANMGTIPSAEEVKAVPPTTLGLESVATAGNYALQFAWSDGHNIGIYTWKLLYQLDPPLPQP